MTLLKCIIIDDEPLAVSLMENYVRENQSLDVIATFLNPIDAIDFLQNNKVDVVFLDIQMPELSGVNFMKIVGNKVKYVLTTAYAEFAMDGYENNVIDYLLKPISLSRFNKSVEKILERIAIKDRVEKDFIFVKSSGQQHKIFHQDILYIESIKDYVNIKTTEQEYIILDTLKSMEEKLPSSHFIRIHKSYILNVHLMKSVAAKSVMLQNGEELPVGDHYKLKLVQILK